MRHISTNDKLEPFADLFDLLSSAPPPTPAEIEARESFAAAWQFALAIAEEPSEASTTDAEGGL